MKEKRTVVYSDEVLAERAAVRGEKKAEKDATKAQMEVLKAHRAEQAEARLKFLLSQSDIFSHFGAVKADTTLDLKATSAASSSSSKKVTKRGSATGLDEMDEDERAMAAAEEDEADGADGTGNVSGSRSKKNTHLSKQPDIITGGEMRSYQLEGLNWMIRLEENGLNGILAGRRGRRVHVVN
jgi:SWI/SNF-related matrix-associated actin-dependent regulator of chromatin subfamily A member 5